VNCPSSHPVKLLDQLGCALCVRDGRSCPPGYYRKKMWDNVGCTGTQDFVVDEASGCVACAPQCSPGYTREALTCPQGQTVVKDRGGCSSCADVVCPRPYKTAPIICQNGWQPVGHPQNPDCVVCAPIPLEKRPIPTIYPSEQESPTSDYIGPATASTPTIEYSSTLKADASWLTPGKIVFGAAVVAALILIAKRK